jgi:type I restriction enzyme S subunit
MDKLSAYTDYKNTSSRWVPCVPAHWQLLRAKHSLREIDDRSTTGEEQLLSMRQHRGLVPHNDVSNKLIGAEHLIGYKRTHPDELVLNRMQAGNAMFFRSSLFGLVSPDYAVFRLIRDDNPEFLGHLFRSAPMRGLFRSESKGLGTGTSGFLRLYSDRFASLTIPMPPRAEQDQIVAYLRVQDAHIARFIKAKRELINLLVEQKLQIIDQAVTRGLDPSVHLKPTGMEWLENVPEHWQIKRLKNIADVVLGKMLTITEKGDGDFKPYLRSTNIQWLTPDTRDIREMWIANSEKSQLRVKKGDLLVSEGGEVGRACLWSDELPECYIQNSVHRIAVKQEMLSEFLYLQFFANGKRGRFESIVNRVSIAHLTREKLVNVVFAVPPIEEQRIILDRVKVDCQPLDEAIERTRREIELLREYRDRLIADVVTGQIDVRDWLPGPDDGVAEEDLAALGGDEDIEADGEDEDGEE